MRASKAERDESFAAFMAGAGPALLRTAWFLTGDTDRAQELTQAAFVKTYVVWHKIDHATALAYARRVWSTTRSTYGVPLATRWWPTSPAPVSSTGLRPIRGRNHGRGQSHGRPTVQWRPVIIATTSCAGCRGCPSNSARSSSCGTTRTSPRHPWPRRSASPSVQ